MDFNSRENLQTGRTDLRKYDIEACSYESSGEYAVQSGFGWTNGVTADFIDHYGF
jgi:neutral trehalase